MTKWCAPSSRSSAHSTNPSADVAQALVPAVSRLVSTRFAGGTRCRTKSVPRSGDAAGRSACATALLPAGVEFVDALAEVFHGLGAADLHGGGEFAVLDGKIAAQDTVLAHLLEGGELFVETSEERRVGKECRSEWCPEKKK